MKGRQVTDKREANEDETLSLIQLLGCAELLKIARAANENAPASNEKNNALSLIDEFSRENERLMSLLNKEVKFSTGDIVTTVMRLQYYVRQNVKEKCENG